MHDFRKRLASFTEKYTYAELEELQREMETIAQLPWLPLPRICLQFTGTIQGRYECR